MRLAEFFEFTSAGWQSPLSLSEFARIMENMSDGLNISALKNRLNEFGFLKAKVGSDSMRPWITQGEEILIATKSIDELQRFDPVVFWNGKALVVHLFLRFNHFKTAQNEAMILTQGLDNSSEDLSVPVSSVLGVAQKKKPWWLGPYMLWIRWVLPRRGRPKERGLE